jgi:hypothetical protein
VGSVGTIPSFLTSTLNAPAVYPVSLGKTVFNNNNNNNNNFTNVGNRTRKKEIFAYRKYDMLTSIVSLIK